MDAEGLGRKLLLNPPPPPRGPSENPSKADCGYCDSISQMLTLQALRALSMRALQREAAWAEERLWAL